MARIPVRFGVLAHPAALAIRTWTMSVTECERHQIFQWYEEAMGSERAKIMMNLVPPVGWGEVATRTDLATLDGGLRGEVGGRITDRDRSLRCAVASYGGARRTLDAGAAPVWPTLFPTAADLEADHAMKAEPWVADGRDPRGSRMTLSSALSASTAADP